jgi:hypothetical protein
MRDAVKLTDSSPCLRNVMPFVKARVLDLLSMYDVECEYSMKSLVNWILNALCGTLPLGTPTILLLYDSHEDCLGAATVA